MSPRRLVITTTYKTRVALEKPCKEHYGTLIGQLKDSKFLSILLRPLRMVTGANAQQATRGERASNGVTSSKQTIAG